MGLTHQKHSQHLFFRCWPLLCSSATPNPPCKGIGRTCNLLDNMLSSAILGHRRLGSSQKLVRMTSVSCQLAYNRANSGLLYTLHVFFTDQETPNVLPADRWTKPLPEERRSTIGDLWVFFVKSQLSRRCLRTSSPRQAHPGHPGGSVRAFELEQALYRKAMAQRSMRRQSKKDGQRQATVAP